MRARGLVDAGGRFTPAGRETKDRVETLTDELAAAPYAALSSAQLHELILALEPSPPRSSPLSSERRRRGPDGLRAARAATRRA